MSGWLGAEGTLGLGPRRQWPAPLIDGPGLGHATRSAAYLSQASCVIVSGFRATLDLDT